MDEAPASDTAQARRDYLGNLPRAELHEMIAEMSERQQRSVPHHWHLLAHAGQCAPPGPWSTWLMLAGRGFGKTRAGAEWVRAIAEHDPRARIALVGASLAEARAVMVEGPSGLLATARARHRPHFEPSRRRLCWSAGRR